MSNLDPRQHPFSSIPTKTSAFFSKIFSKECNQLFQHFPLWYELLMASITKCLFWGNGPLLLVWVHSFHQQTQFLLCSSNGKKKKHNFKSISQVYSSSRGRLVIMSSVLLQFFKNVFIYLNVYEFLSECVSVHHVSAMPREGFGHPWTGITEGCEQ